MGTPKHQAGSEKSVGDFFAEWLEVARLRLRPSTWLSYQTNIERHIIPALGEVPLRSLTPTQLNTFYARLLEAGRIDGKGGLGPKTVSYIHRIIVRALKDAVRWADVDRSVAGLVDHPKGKSPPMSTWSADELRRFLAQVRDDRHHAAWLLAATTGMRRGEILGLRWQDLDLSAGRLRVHQTLLAVRNRLIFSDPKTRSGRRQIALAPAVVAILERHRLDQENEKEGWLPAHIGCDLVFTLANGAPVHPDKFTKLFSDYARTAGLPHIRLHDLRHTFATLALTNGIHTKVVSEILGHSNIGITLEIYSHALPLLHEEAVIRLADILLEGEEYRAP